MDIEENQITSLLRQPSEGLQVEIKSWVDPRTEESIAKIIKAIFAIRNRNGGFLIIGFDDDTLLPGRYSLDQSVDKLYHVDTIQALAPTCFSTWPFSHAAPGVHATGSTKWWEHSSRKRRLSARSLPTNTVLTAVFMLS